MPDQQVKTQITRSKIRSTDKKLNQQIKRQTNRSKVRSKVVSTDKKNKSKDQKLDILEILDEQIQARSTDQKLDKQTKN